MTAKEISEKIFYSPATTESILEGERLIKAYTQEILIKAGERTAKQVHWTPEEVEFFKRWVRETPLD